MSSRSIALTVLWLITLACGWHGFYSITPTAPALSHLYSTLQLFSLNGSFPNGPLPLEADIARFVAPVLTLYTAIITFAGSFMQAARRFKARYFLRDHIVVCGLGHKGLAIATDLLANGKSVVVLDPAPQEEHILAILAYPKSVFINASATNATALTGAGVQHAQHVFVVCGNDAINSEVWSTLADQKTTAELTVHVHMQDLSLAQHLELRADNLLREKHAPRLRILNTYQAAVRQLFESFPFNTTSHVYDSGRPHLVFLGFGQMGRHVLLEALRLYTSAAVSQKINISVIDRNAVRIWREFEANHPSIEQLCQVSLVETDILNEKKLLINLQKQADPVSAFYVCLDNDVTTLREALYLRKSSLQLKNSNAPIFAYLRASPGFESLTCAVKGATKLASGVVAFGSLKHTLTAKVLLNESLDTLAKNFHEFYLDKYKTVKQTQDLTKNNKLPPAQQPWKDLSETYRRANRHAADHLAIKLRSLDCRLFPASKPAEQPKEATQRFEFTAEETALLAQQEHQRWCAERFLDGWRYSAVRSDIAKLHPALMRWDELQIDEQGKNKQSIKELPLIAGKAGFEVKRELMVGVTGHRVYKNPDAVTKQIRTLLQRLVNEHPDHKMICISALAAGADQEVARIALSEFAAELWVVTPFPLELYMEDFKGEEDDFNTLLNQASQLFEMPLRFGSVTQVASEQDVRNNQYALAGAFVAARSHQLVAVWDGLEARGKGGTAEVVSWAQDKKLPQNYAFPGLLHKPLAQLNIIRVER